jgi:hypothetical protein
MERDNQNKYLMLTTRRAVADTSIRISGPSKPFNNRIMGTLIVPDTR